MQNLIKAPISLEKRFPFVFIIFTLELPSVHDEHTHCWNVPQKAVSCRKHFNFIQIHKQRFTKLEKERRKRNQISYTNKFGTYCLLLLLLLMLDSLERKKSALSCASPKLSFHRATPSWTHWALMFAENLLQKHFVETYAPECLNWFDDGTNQAKEKKNKKKFIKVLTPDVPKSKSKSIFIST